MAGNLYIVATPIGNLGDMTYRAVEILKQVDLIGAEDTRTSKKLLNHFEIDTKMVSYHRHNTKEKTPYFIDLLKEGKDIALISDAGTPAISDPGEELVKAAILEEITVIPIPGASAFVTALMAGGLPTDEFSFHGFLPQKKKEQEILLHRLQQHTETLIFYEAPHRILKTLQILKAHLGDREATLGRELTKKYEEFMRGSLSTLIDLLKEREIKGEFVVLIGGYTKEEESDETYLKILKDLLNEGTTKKEAITYMTTTYQLPKNKVYQWTLEIEKGEEL